MCVCVGDDYAEVREPERQLLGRPILPREVILEERIGEGQFGDVHKGILYPGVSYVGWLLVSVASVCVPQCVCSSFVDICT